MLQIDTYTSIEKHLKPWQSAIHTGTGEILERTQAADRQLRWKQIQKTWKKTLARFKQDRIGSKPLRTACAPLDELYKAKKKRGKP